MKYSCFEIFTLFVISLIFSSLAIAQNTDTRFNNFDTNKPVCKTLSNVVNALSTSVRYKIADFCTTFVGTYTTQLGDYQEITLVTGNVPLRTVTVTGNAKLRRRRADPLEVDPAEPMPAISVAVHQTDDTGRPLITQAPEYPFLDLLPKTPYHPFDDVASKIGILPRQAAAAAVAAAPLSTPSIFKSQASLAIRTGCACLGISTQITLPLWPTRTVTSTRTVPLSCAKSPYSAYNFAGLGPSSINRAPYYFGNIPISPASQIVSECCTYCADLSGCVYFIIKPNPNYADYFDCELYRFDDTYYEYQPNPAQTGPGLPAVATDRDICPRGYVAVNSLTKKSLASGAVTGTFLGPCAVTTVRR